MPMLNRQILSQNYLLTSLVGLTSAVTLTLVVFLVPKNARIPLVGLSLLSLVAAQHSTKMRGLHLAEEHDFLDIESNANKQRLMLDNHDFTLQGSTEQTEQKVEKTEEKTASLKIFDEGRWNVDSVHIAVLASTGSGKSFFLRYLLNTAFHGQPLLLIDPHNDKGITLRSKQDALDVLKKLSEGSIKSAIVGYGRDYLSISYMLQALGGTEGDDDNELSRRFREGGEGKDHPMINVVVEELPSIVQNIDFQPVSKGLVTSTLQTYLTEARKVNLRLIVVTQGSQVKLLGLKGISSLGSAYRFIRLGEEAIRYAQSHLKNETLVEKLTDDFYKSLDLHKKTKSKQRFRGTCFMVDDEYLPFRDLRIFGHSSIESDILDGHFSKPMEPDPVTWDTVEVGTDETATDAESLETLTEWGATTPEKEVTVHLEGLDDYWLSLYKSSEGFDQFERLRPAYVKDRHVEEFFRCRNDGDSASKAAKKFYNGSKYSKAKQWLTELYIYLTEVK